jgi:hypothetical protein
MPARNSLRDAGFAIRGGLPANAVCIIGANSHTPRHTCDRHSKVGALRRAQPSEVAFIGTVHFQ